MLLSTIAYRFRLCVLLAIAAGTPITSAFALPLLVVVEDGDEEKKKAKKGDEEEPESGDGQAAPDKPVGASEEAAQAMPGFKKPAGWKVSLFAAEPALANPVALTVDAQGRVYVCESFRQDRGVTDNRAHDREWLLADLAAQSVQDRIDYHHRLLGEDVEEYTAHDDGIRVLEDTDSDGVADRSVMLAQGFNKVEEGTGAGILVRGNEAYYTCIPKLWKLTDSDGDQIADQRVALHDGYGVRVAFRGHDSHGLIIGPAGRLYFSIGDRGYNVETPNGVLKNVESGAVFRCELDGSNLEVFATGLRNPQELAFDDQGYLFTGDNNSDSGDKARWVNVMQGGDSGWRMMYQYLPDRGPFNREKIWYPYDKTTTPAYIVPPIANFGDGPSGLACYPGTGLTGDYENCFFMVDFRGGASNSGVRLIRCERRGAFWEVERSEQPLWNILATDFEFGPDGRIYVCDWVNGWVGEGKGRVYRFEDTEAQQQSVVREVQAMLATGFTESSVSRLVELMGHPDRRIRFESQWELASRNEIQALRDAASDEDNEILRRMHGVWGIMHACRVHSPAKPETISVLKGLAQDDESEVRRLAIQAIGELKIASLEPEVVASILDEEPSVGYAACLAAFHLQSNQAIGNAAELLADNADVDPGIRHAGIMALAGISDDRMIAELKAHSSRSVRLAAVIALRKKESPVVAEFLRDADQQVVLETIRAIHDVQTLHTLLPKLTDFDLEPYQQNDAIVHRVLNANFRIGDDACAVRVAKVAANAYVSEPMRLEALDMLASWKTPGKLDRVMNRFDPLPNRSQSGAVAAFEAELPQFFGGSSAIVEKSINSASALGISSASDRLLELVNSETKPATIRAAALAGYARLSPDQAETIAQQAYSSAPSLVQATAVQILSRTAAEKHIALIVDATNSESIEVRQSAWDALGGIQLDKAKEVLELAAKDYITGGLAPDVWLNVKEAAAKQNVNADISDFESKLASKTPLEEFRDAVYGGDAQKGKQLFFGKTELSCVRCHRVGATGGEVGPELTQIGKSKDNRYLLEAIVYPDAKIAENFETVVLLNEDDELLTGILRKETPTEIELIDAEGKAIVLDPETIVARRKGKSSMPADLHKTISRRELRDLVAYLSTLGEAGDAKVK